MGVNKTKYVSKFRLRPIENGYLISTLTNVPNKKDYEYGETFVKTDQELEAYILKYAGHHLPKLFNKPQKITFEVTINEAD